MELRQLLDVAMRATSTFLEPTARIPFEANLATFVNLSQQLLPAVQEWREEIRGRRWKLSYSPMSPEQMTPSTKTILLDGLAAEYVGRIWSAWWFTCEERSTEPRLERGIRMLTQSELFLRELVDLHRELLGLIRVWGEKEPKRSAEIDHLRKQIERWTDRAIGPLATLSCAGRFAHRIERAWELGEERRRSQRFNLDGTQIDQDLLSIRSVLPGRRLRDGISGELRQDMLCQLPGLGSSVSR